VGWGGKGFLTLNYQKMMMMMMMMMMTMMMMSTCIAQASIQQMLIAHEKEGGTITQTIEKIKKSESRSSFVLGKKIKINK
jgi:uncharacterized membrane protein YjgN (DUF898 family)